MPESIYIHIPFCLKKCGYCDFLSVPFDEGLSLKYVEALVKELSMRGGRGLKTIYFGGGTPTVLRGESLMRIFKTVRDSFEVSKDAEITMEANPGTIDERKLELLLSLGINRMSMGVQSFSDNELKTLGRLHTSKEAYDAAMFLKKFFTNFSLDLMYSVPGQTAKSWKATLESAVEAAPAHISAYELTPEKCTPLYGLLEDGALKMPDGDEAADMFYLASDLLGEAGYRHYEISNYALPGYECGHNVNYWRRGEYIGAGAGAHSFLDGRRAVNTGDLKEYIGMLSSGALPVKEEAGVTPEDALKEYIFLGLRMKEGIDISGHPDIVVPAGLTAPPGLGETGLLELEAGRMRLTERGMAVSNSVIVEVWRASGLDKSPDLGYTPSTHPTRTRDA